MLDLLAAISSIDPPSLLAWLILAFAAAGYPLGIMLGSSCSPCCQPQNPCSQCTEGELPETLTVTFSGLADQTPGPDLCLLTFSAPYGSGAAGKVTAPGGDPATDKGPLGAVSLTNGGSGYAKKGRVAPTITASGGSGTGATFSAQATKNTDANGIPSWSVTGVTFTGTTSGYVEGDQITFEVADGDTAEQGAAATIHTVRTQPTVTATASGGTGASLGVTTAPNGTTPQTWSVTGVTVSSGGTGYPASGAVTFNVASGDSVEQPAYAAFYCGRVEPTVTASVYGSSGSGAALTPTLTQGVSWWDGKPIWRVDSVTIDDGGSGYSEGEYVPFSSPDGDGYGYGVIGSVDENGAITSVYAYYSEFYKSNGIIESIAFYPAYGGIYYRDAGTISSVSVEGGGVYYREDASLQPYVATVTVGITQTAPSTGTGASLSVTIDDDTGSETFGQITGVNIDDGGSGYLAWQWKNTLCCGDYYNGLSVVCKRSAASPCTYSHAMCGVGNLNAAAGTVTVSYSGPNMPPTVVLVSESGGSQICNTTFTASENVADCGDWRDSEDGPIECVAPGGATATVAAGGEYDAAFRNPGNQGCHICCKGDAVPPEEFEVQIKNQHSTLYDGTYVVAKDGPGNWYGSAAGISLYVSLDPCTGQSATHWGGATLSGSTGISLYNSLYDQQGCNECHKTCDLWIILSVPIGYNAPSFSAENCGGCISTPLCQPPAGTYDLCSRYFLSTVGFVLDCEEEAGPGSLGGSHFKATIS